MREGEGEREREGERQREIEKGGKRKGEREHITTNASLTKTM